VNNFDYVERLWDRGPQEKHEIVDEQIAYVAQQRIVTPNSGGYA
jgi:hypothetical protein